MNRERDVSPEARDVNFYETEFLSGTTLETAKHSLRNMDGESIRIVVSKNFKIYISDLLDHGEIRNVAGLDHDEVMGQAWVTELDGKLQIRFYKQSERDSIQDYRMVEQALDKALK